MSEQPNTRSKLLSAIMGAAGLGQRRSPISRHSLMGMGGTFGHGRIRHCSTWDIGYDMPRSAGDRMEIRQQVQARRKQSRTEGGELAGASLSHDRFGR